MASDIKVLAGDWSRLSLTTGGVLVSDSVFGKGNFRSWGKVADLTVNSTDSNSRKGETSFTLVFEDGKKVFASSMGKTFHALQTAYTAHKVAAERGAKPAGEGMSFAHICLAVVLSAAVLIFLVAFVEASMSSGPSTAAAGYHESAAAQAYGIQALREESDAIDAAKDAVRQILREPSSATFDEAHYKPATRTVCGTVNARNGFGGFNGASPFIVVNGAAAVQPSPADPDYDRFRSIYESQCLN